MHNYIAERGLLGTLILWIEHEDDGPKRPETYRQACPTSVTTHDLPPSAGYLTGEHVDLRESLGLLDRPVEEERDADTAPGIGAVAYPLGDRVNCGGSHRQRRVTTNAPHPRPPNRSVCAHLRRPRAQHQTHSTAAARARRPTNGSRTKRPELGKTCANPSGTSESLCQFGAVPVGVANLYFWGDLMRFGSRLRRTCFV